MGTPASSSVVACRWRRPCSRAGGNGVAGPDWLCRLISLAMSAVTVSGYSGSPHRVTEDKPAIVAPRRSGGEPFFGLLAAVVAEDRHGVAVEADRAGPAALGGALDALAADDGGGAAEGDLGR